MKSNALTFIHSTTVLVSCALACIFSVVFFTHLFNFLIFLQVLACLALGSSLNDSDEKKKARHDNIIKYTSGSPWGASWVYSLTCLILVMLISAGTGRAFAPIVFFISASLSYVTLKEFDDYRKKVNDDFYKSVS